MICKECGYEFELIEGLQYCPKCGFKIEEERYDCAWENRDKYGFMDALFETWKKSLIEPTVFFKSVSPRGGIKDSMLYAIIIGWIGFCFSIFWEFIFRKVSFGHFFRNPAIEQVIGSWILLVIAIFAPVLIIISLFISSVIYHFCLWIFGGAKNGYGATFKAVSYSTSPILFQVIPFCGGLIGSIWTLVLTIIGIKELHKTTTIRALFAILLPLVVCLGLGVILTMFFISFLTMAR